MQTLSLCLFGRLKIVCANQSLVQLEPRRAQELLCYLLLYRDRLHEREKLATLFWPESSAVQAKRYLRQTLWQLQSGLNSEQTNTLLCVEHERIGVNAAGDYWLDVDVLEQAYSGTREQLGRTLGAAQAAQIEAAVALYQDDLLEGWYQDWCIYERERLQNLYLALLDKLADYHEHHRCYEAGVNCAMQILRYDRAREQTHYQLMRLYHLAGNRSAAMRQYETCVAALREELDVPPSARTVALYQQISQRSTRSFVLIPNPPALTPQPTDTLQHLEQIQLTLTQLQAQVAQLMQTMR